MGLWSLWVCGHCGFVVTVGLWSLWGHMVSKHSPLLLGGVQHLLHQPGTELRFGARFSLSPLHSPLTLEYLAGLLVLFKGYFETMRSEVVQGLWGTLLLN